MAEDGPREMAQCFEERKEKRDKGPASPVREMAIAG
jgi:hypothetical protein